MASSAGPEGSSGVDLGRIIGRAFSTIGGNPAATLGIAFLFTALPTTLLNLLMQQMRPEARDLSGVPTWLGATVATGLVALVLSLITQGALMRATVSAEGGDRASFADCAATGLKAALPLLGLGILSGLGIGLGLILLLVPGLILMTMWTVSGPAVVAERLGPIAAMRRSAELTSGARWKVFGLLLLLGIANAMLQGAVAGTITQSSGGGLSMARMMAQGGFPTVWIIVSVLVTTVTGAVGAIVQASLYIELREWKEGPALDRLADVFA
jgi:hypothetical protein